MIDHPDRLASGDFRTESGNRADAAEIRRMEESVEHLRERLRESFGAVSRSAASVLSSSHAQVEMTSSLKQAADDNQREVDASVHASESVAATFRSVARRFQGTHHPDGAIPVAVRNSIFPEGC